MNVFDNGKAETEELTRSVSSSVASFKDRNHSQMSAAQTSLPINHTRMPPAEDVYDDGYLRIEHENYYLACGGQPLYLPRVEFLLISRLARSIERVVSAEDLWRAAWADSKPLNCGSLHVYIHRLRSKLRPYGLQIDPLVNVGYRLTTQP